MQRYIIKAEIEIDIEVEYEEDIKKVIEDKNNIPFYGVSGFTKENNFYSFETTNIPVKVLKIKRY